MSGTSGHCHTVHGTSPPPRGIRKDGAEATRVISLGKAEKEQMGGAMERWDRMEGKNRHSHWWQGPSKKLRGTRKWGRQERFNIPAMGRTWVNELFGEK